LGVLYVASYIEEKGYKVHILDANARSMDSESVLGEVPKIKPNVVGLTGTPLSYLENLKIARAIKNRSSATGIKRKSKHFCF
jgi:hypothetical protein